MKNILKNKKQFLSVLFFIVTLLIYLGFSIHEGVAWKGSLKDWRKNNIENSPTVYKTSSGEKYHQSYHYRNRNHPISLFLAKEQGLTPCAVCNPPSMIDFPSMPEKPPFYFRYSFIFSILFTLIFYILFIKFIKK